MVRKEQFYFRSSDEVTRLRGMKWFPEDRVKAVIQVCHGMCEHLDRYDAFATFLAEHGYLVVMHDLIGHGLSAASEQNLGIFGEYMINSKLVADLFKVRCMMQKEYSHVPFFVMGHSMGSLIMREYILTHREGLAGVILMGTVDYGNWMCRAGILLLKLIGLCHKDGMRYRSILVHNLGLGRFDKAFEDEGLRNAWLSRDREEVQMYNHDPLCNYTYSIGVFDTVLRGMLNAHDKDKLDSFPKDVPVLLLGGGDDVVNAMGKTTTKLYRIYKSYGWNVRMHVYKGARHELLHETNRNKVSADILKWLDAKM